MIKRLKWAKPAGHRVHRVNNKFAKCNCIFVKPIVMGFFSKLSPKRIRASVG